MKASIHAPALTLPLLLAAAVAAADTPRFAVPTGATVRKTFEESTEWTVTSLRQIANGTEMPLPPIGMEGLFSSSLVLVDEYTEMAGERPASLRRAVERAEATVDSEVTVQNESEDYTLSLACPLADAVVRFDWDDDEGAFDARLEDGGTADGALNALVEDADLRGVLPPAGTEEGATWKLDAAALTCLLRPGGSWTYRAEAVPDGGYQMVDVEDVLSTAFLGLATFPGDPTGEGTATWTETREVDGQELAVLTLDFELELEGDASEAYVASLDAVGFTPSRHDVVLELGWTVLGEGELLWNLTAGRFESHDLELTSELEVAMHWLESYGSVDVEAAISAELEARTELTARVGDE